MSSEHTDELDTDTETGDRTEPSVSGDRAERLRSKYGLIRGELKNRPEQFTEFDRSLVQARITQSYDTYLSRAIRRAILSTFLLLAVQIVLVLGLTRVIRVKSLQQSIARFPGIAVGVICFVSLVGGVLVFATYYYYPQFKARQRRRRIDSTLPHAIVFMCSVDCVSTGSLRASSSVFREINGELDAVWRYGTPQNPCRDIS